MEHIDNLMVHEYLEKMAEPSFPGPASGSAAATAAAMAAALLEKSCKVTMKKSRVSIPIVLNEIEEIRFQCQTLATEDMIALAEVVRIAKYRKELPEKYEYTMKGATDTLISIMRNCEFILGQIEQLVPICNKRVVAELIAGTYMAIAALSSAKLGAEANLHLLQDENYKEYLQDTIRNSYGNSIDTRERILNLMKTRQEETALGFGNKKLEGPNRL